MKKKIQLICNECLVSNYTTNKSTVSKRMELKKFCNKCKKHTNHKENK